MSYGSCQSTVAEFAVIQLCPTGQHWDSSLQQCVDDGNNNLLLIATGVASVIAIGAGVAYATKKKKKTKGEK